MINWNTARDKLVKDDLKVLYHLYYRKEINATDLVSQLWITWKEAMIL